MPATLLPNGTVLAAGGDTPVTTPTQNIVTETASSEIYDPVAGTWAATGSLTWARDAHTATLLPNGTVLAAGGAENRDVALKAGAVATAELYVPGH